MKVFMLTHEVGTYQILSKNEYCISYCWTIVAQLHNKVNSYFQKLIQVSSNYVGNLDIPV